MRDFKSFTTRRGLKIRFKPKQKTHQGISQVRFFCAKLASYSRLTAVLEFNGLHNPERLEWY